MQTQTEKRETETEKGERPSSTASRRSRPPAGIWGMHCVCLPTLFFCFGVFLLFVAFFGVFFAFLVRVLWSLFFLVFYAFLVRVLWSSSRVHGSDSFLAFLPAPSATASAASARPCPFIFTRYPACRRRSDACLGLGLGRGCESVRAEEPDRVEARRSALVLTHLVSLCPSLSLSFQSPSPSPPRPIYIPSPHIPPYLAPYTSFIYILYIPPVPYLRPGPRASPHQTIRLTSVLGPWSLVLCDLCFQKYDSTV